MGKWPAVDVTHPGDPDLLLAMVDDFAPTAAERRDKTFRIFFPSRAARDAGCVVLAAARYRAEAVDVDDEDWARRSQDTLVPVTVGRITIAPPWAAPGTQPPAPGTIVILPSMGFGTGHHATTRLCVGALQAVDIADRAVLDVGTGSGVLAIAAVRLGAARAVGIDHDPDAIAAANENLALNPEARTVEFRVGDLLTEDLPAADVVTANLTGALLVRSAALLLNLLRPAGTLIVSGILDEERNDVLRAFAGRPEVGGTLMTLVWEDSEDGWVALAMKRP